MLSQRRREPGTGARAARTTQESREDAVGRALNLVQDDLDRLGSPTARRDYLHARAVRS